jgi:hypothetical protein
MIQNNDEAMKKGLLTLVLLLVVASLAYAQEPEKPRWDLGVELVQLNLNSIRSFPPSELQAFQPLPGAYLRYSFGRWGLRFGVGYSQNYTAIEGANCNDCGSGSLHGANAGLRSGVQFSLTKQRDWLYAVADLNFRYYAGKGNYMNYAWGYVRYDYRVRSTELLLQLGPGLQGRIFRQLYLGGECLLGFGRKHENRAVYNDVNGPDHNLVRSNRVLFRPTIRLQMGVKF